MVRYSVRHWCHVSCGIERWGVDAFLAKLTPYQINQLPAVILNRYPGAIEKANELLDRAGWE
ncbi:MAG: hypothetical protein JO356_02800 [Acidobacteria bacterium]|nr:hypothetical protein [Acidobacteriota bacterium]